MSTPTVSVSSGVVTVIPATSNPPGAVPATSYNVGVRLATDPAGTYQFHTNIPATANPISVSLAALGITAAGNYDAAAQAVTPIGTTSWGPEFSFIAGVLPNPPQVTVA